MLTYQDCSLVEWLTLPSLSQTAGYYSSSNTKGSVPAVQRQRTRRPSDQGPAIDRGMVGIRQCAATSALVSENKQETHRRRFTLCSCETITIMGYRAEKSWGNARWAIGLRERTTSAILQRKPSERENEFSSSNQLISSVHDFQY